MLFSARRECVANATSRAENMMHSRQSSVLHQSIHAREDRERLAACLRRLCCLYLTKLTHCRDTPNSRAMSDCERDPLRNAWMIFFVVSLIG
jgi:hypothetical protein